MLFVDRDQRFSCPTLAVAVELAAVNAAGLQDVADSTLHWWRSAVARLTRYVGDVRLDQLTSRAIYDWHRGIAAVASAVTANSYLRAVRSVLSRLVRAGLLADSPARFVSYLPEPARTPKAATLATYERLRSAATIARDVAIVDALWATGCRLAGLLSMTVDRLEFWRADDELRMAAVVVEKFGRSRYVYARSPQADSIAAWVAERPAVDSPALFLSLGDRHYGRPLGAPAVHAVLRRLRLAAGLPASAPCGAHSFRHAFAIRKLDEGHDLAAVAAWLGHADPSFTARVYANRREDELRRKWFEKAT